MKKLHYIIIITLLLTTSIMSAQTIVGDWHGLIENQGIKLRVIFKIFEDNGVYRSTLDSPDQGATNIPVTSTTFENNTINITMKNIGITYIGELKEDIIEGTFTQGGGTIPMNLSREIQESGQNSIRPQDPIKPYSYYSEDVTFINHKANGIKLAGTLTIPNDVDNPPVVILISGSGGQNRDSELAIFNHRPFLVWSDYLTNNGIAVLRYDDRGIAESEGSQYGATSADNATDVAAAVAYLQTRKDINLNKIGLIGHSEGGFIAPMIAAKNKSINFIVLLAGTGVLGTEVLTTQARKAMELAGVDANEIDFNEQIKIGIQKIILEEKDNEKIQEKIIVYMKGLRSTMDSEKAEMITDEFIQDHVDAYNSEWLTYFMRTDPDQFLSQVKCPVLAINGDKDSQVLADLNLNGIEASLIKAKNDQVTIVKMPGLNHLLQTSETGSFSEYGQIEETISPEALDLVTKWILTTTSAK